MDDVPRVADVQPAPGVAPAAQTMPAVDLTSRRPHQSRRRRWPRALGAVLLVLVLAAVATAFADQRSQLNSTRGRLDALQASQSASAKSMSSTLTTQQQQLTGLSAQLATQRTELQTDEARLKEDEQQLKLTTQQLPPDLTALAAKVSPSVVFIGCYSATSASLGTAFALDIPPSPGYATTLVTAEHVVDGCTDPTNGNLLEIGTDPNPPAVQLRSFDRTNDVAVLDTTEKLPALEPATSAPVVGEFVMAVGNSLGVVLNNATSGSVSQLDGDTFYDTAPVSNGNSGGPVVTRDATVLGIVDYSETADADTPVVENLNGSVRLTTLCRSLLHGSVCSRLH